MCCSALLDVRLINMAFVATLSPKTRVNKMKKIVRNTTEDCCRRLSHGAGKVQEHFAEKRRVSNAGQLKRMDRSFELAPSSSVLRSTALSKRFRPKSMMLDVTSELPIDFLRYFVGNQLILSMYD